jgi:hypothetical protein
MIYLQILRFALLAAFMYGSYWLAMEHHHDSTALQTLLVMLPLAGFGAINFYLYRDKIWRKPG